MKKNQLKTLVITGFGLNCEKETAAAIEHVGGSAELVHLNDLIAGKRKLEEFHFLTFIGGFSFGDHLGSGTVFANKVKFSLREQLEKFVADGKLVIGICNGFQTLTRLGLVPALNGHYFQQEAALAHNDSGLFRDDWCTLKVEAGNPSVFLRGIDTVRLPLRHGEGKFVAEPEVLDAIEKNHQVAVRYVNSDGSRAEAFPENPNGSLNSIAGITDPTGRIFGLMPHPEAFLSPYNAPDWTLARSENRLPKEGDGVVFFANAIDYLAQTF
ncbi:MAG: phosphoribosylformylglycinamidine synthase subunit PurQ [Victivallaceae bacterium]|nr:phosphoribosylformylglycinamidine synthase subunit PurQ [Victivallaceae bacterium]